MIEREETPTTTCLRNERCTITIERVQPGTLLVTIAGYDRGDFGTAVFDALHDDLLHAAPVELFIDASGARGAAWAVSQLWSQWFHAQQHRLARVHILVGSRLLEQTILVARELSRTANLLVVHTDPARFADVLQERVPSWSGA